jgi:drug/metabolite transporter (DMT)-like permease
MPQKMAEPGAMLALSAISLLAIMGTALAVLLFNSLIQRAGAVFASTVTYVVPVFAVMWGVVDGEHLQLAHALGIGTVLIGVNIMNKSQKADI